MPDSCGWRGRSWHGPASWATRRHICPFDSHGSEDRSSDVLVEGVLNWPEGKGAYLEIRDLAPSQVLMLASHPEMEDGAVV